MSTPFKPGWADAAGKAGAEHDSTAYLTAVRPRLWKPGTRAQQHERNRRAGVTGGANTKLARKLDETLGVADAEGEE
jgi:hypothetical protein